LDNTYYFRAFIFAQLRQTIDYCNWHEEIYNEEFNSYTLSFRRLAAWIMNVSPSVNGQLLFCLYMCVLIRSHHSNVSSIHSLFLSFVRSPPPPQCCLIFIRFFSYFITFFFCCKWPSLSITNFVYMSPKNECIKKNRNTIDIWIVFGIIKWIMIFADWAPQNAHYYYALLIHWLCCRICNY
jgi:hypothetical protein